MTITPMPVPTFELIDALTSVHITASFERKIALNSNVGPWSFTVAEPSIGPTTSWTFWLPSQVSEPPDPVIITLMRNGQTWATFPWKPEAVVTALPVTSTSISSKGTTSSPLPKSPTSSTSSATETTSTTGLGKGEAVGLGVGTAIAGALLALLVGFFCLRRKNSRRKAFSQSPLEVTQPADPQPITHKRLTDEALLLEAAIQHYVDNYLSPATTTKYGNADPTSRRDSQLSQLAAHDESWQQLFLDSATQYSAWRMFIARVLAARIDRKGATDVTLLPVEALKRYQSLVDGRDRTTHYDAWRETQNGLGRNKYPKDSTLLGAEDARNYAVEETVQDIQSALRPFRHKQGGEADSEQESLRRLVVDTALFGWRLFSESQLTGFFWSDSPNGGMEVFPGVRRIRAPRQGGQQIVIREPSCH